MSIVKQTQREIEDEMDMCTSLSDTHHHDCLCNDTDPECDNIPQCRLCGDDVF